MFRYIKTGGSTGLAKSPISTGGNRNLINSKIEIENDGHEQFYCGERNDESSIIVRQEFSPDQMIVVDESR